ncbi:MAG: nucleotide exchange factor GrpE [Eubacteriales bacterium]|nr:nucleotide exchange factor GrpE [Eubacteriales bacterium]
MEIKESGNREMNTEETAGANAKAEAIDQDNDSDEAVGESELLALKQRVADLEKQTGEYYEMLKRTAAEFDNYKKRTNKEKDAICNLVIGETVAEFLDFVDDIERAAENAKNEADSPLKEGLLLLHREIKDVLKKLDVNEIESVGEKFNPDTHCAVMHVEDDNYGENEVIEEFKKGYIHKDKIIRHSVVKVAN